MAIVSARHSMNGEVACAACGDLDGCHEPARKLQAGTLQPAPPPVQSQSARVKRWLRDGASAHLCMVYKVTEDATEITGAAIFNAHPSGLTQNLGPTGGGRFAELVSVSGYDTFQEAERALYRLIRETPHYRWVLRFLEPANG